MTASPSNLKCVPEGGSGNGKRNSPEILSAVILLDKLDTVSAMSVDRRDLSDDSSGNLRAPRMPEHDGRSNRQLALQMDGSSMPVQVRRLHIRGERTLMTIFTGQSYRSIQPHPVTAPLADGTSSRGGSGHGPRRRMECVLCVVRQNGVRSVVIQMS